MDSYLEKPLVSILVLSMNHEKYIQQCLSSCIEQTYTNKEIIFLDNCSTDKTALIANEVLKASSVPYKFLNNTTSQSITVNCNRLIKESNGDAIILISGDDWMKPENVAAKMNVMLTDAEIGLVYSSGFYYYEDTKRLERHPSEKHFKRGNVEKELFRNNFVFTPGVLVRRSVFEKAGNFDEACPVEDYDMWLRVSAVSKIDYVDEPLVYYRKHSSNISGNTGFMRKSHIYLLEKYKNHKHFSELKQHFQYSEIYFTATHNTNLKGLFLILGRFMFTGAYFNILVLWVRNFFRRIRGLKPAL